MSFLAAISMTDEHNKKDTNSISLKTVKKEMQENLHKAFDQIREQDQDLNKFYSEMGICLNELNSLAESDYVCQEAIDKLSKKKKKLKKACKKISTIFPKDEDIKHLTNLIQEYLIVDSACSQLRQHFLQETIGSLSNIIAKLSGIWFVYR